MTFFSESDFETMDVWHSDTLAKHCNEKLQREAKVVEWPDGKNCRILFLPIEEIERKPCEHPKEFLQTHSDFHNAKCGKCGVKLKAKWEVVNDQAIK